MMAFLVLAMFAVSSTSRSTTVRAARPVGRLVVSSTGQQRMARTAAPAEEPVACDGEGDEQLAAGRCGWLQASEQLVSSRTGRKASPTRMIGARVEVAENLPAAWPMPLVLDCRSHSDRVYDRLIYGIADDDLATARPRVEALSDEPAASEGEWLTIFRSLVAPERGSAPPLTAGASVSRSVGIGPFASTAMSLLSLGRGTIGLHSEWSRVRTLASSLRNWLAAQLSRLGSQWDDLLSRAAARNAAALDWNEYAELIDRATATVSATAVSTGTSGVDFDVRFGSWVRHSAASSLYQLGLLLQVAGRELDRDDNRSTTASTTVSSR